MSTQEASNLILEMAATCSHSSGRKWPPAFSCHRQTDWLAMIDSHSHWIIAFHLRCQTTWYLNCFSPPISNMCSSHPRCRNSEGSMLPSCILKQVAATCSHEFNCSLPRRCARPRCWISSVLRRILTRRCWRLLVGTWKLLRRFDAWTSLRALMTGWPQCSQWTSRIRDATRRKLTYQ